MNPKAPLQEGSGPAYIPGGYRFRQRLIGESVMAFGRSVGQVALVYNKGWEAADWNTPLTVYSGSADAPSLIATEMHAGHSLDIGIAGTQVVYHDGLWQRGPGAVEQTNGADVVHWDSSSVHSITIRTAGPTYGVRGPKNSVGFDDLVRIAQSLPF
jgi:hypothetical protein